MCSLFVAVFIAGLIATTALIATADARADTNAGGGVEGGADGAASQSPSRTDGIGVMPNPPIGSSIGLLRASASGVSVTGAAPVAAQPMVVATSDMRAAAAREAGSGVVTATGVMVSAGAVGDHTAAHASVAETTVGRHRIGPVAAHCRDGVPSVDRAGTVRLARNKVVTYGLIKRHRAIGAVIVVLGPAERPVHVVTVAEVSCPARYLPRYLPGPAASSTSPTPSTTPSRTPSTTSPAKPPATSESASRGTR